MYSEQSLYEIIIIGAGPAGISLAAEAVESGVAPHKIIILEKSDNHSWSIRKFYPDEKLVTANYKGNDVSCVGNLCIMDSSKDETLNYLGETIQKYKLDVRYKHNADEIQKLANGQYVVCSSGECFVTKTVALAIGVMGRPNKPSYKIPSEVNKNIFYDISGDKLNNKKILVVGGGDSASEYAQYLVQRGNSVSLSYRREKFVRMNDINYKTIHKLNDQGKCTLLMNTDISSLEKEGEGVKVNFKEAGPQVFDAIVYALGGTTPKNFLETIGIKMTKEGPDVTDFFESEKREGIFLLGDLSAGRGGGSINLAFNHSHKAMKELCTMYLDCSEEV